LTKGDAEWFDSRACKSLFPQPGQGSMRVRKSGRWVFQTQRPFLSRGQASWIPAAGPKVESARGDMHRFPQATTRASP
jgi:hypothetical protein